LFKKLFYRFANLEFHTTQKYAGIPLSQCCGVGWIEKPSGTSQQHWNWGGGNFILDLNN